VKIGVNRKKMQQEEGASSMDPWAIFLYGIKAPMTREKYRGRLAKFFDFVGLIEPWQLFGYLETFRSLVLVC
jgi:hypothetical protein